MKLNEAISLQESPQSDMEHRRRAQKAHRDLLRAVDRIGGALGMYPRPNGLIAPDFVLNHPEGITFVIIYREQGERNIGGINKAGDRLVLFMDEGANIGDELEKDVYERTVIHEFIHVFQKERFGVMRPTANLGNADYYNDPSETDAYIQETLHKFEDRMRRLPPNFKEKYIPRIMRDYKEFESLFFTFMDNDFEQQLNARNERKLKRRLYRYWDEVVRAGNIG